MANISKEVAVADAAAGTDIFANELEARSPRARVLDSFALTGSAAAGDTEVEIMIGGRSIGHFTNTSTGLAIDMTKDVRKVDEFVRANDLVQCMSRTAPGTNPVRVEATFTRPASGGTRRRTSSRRRSTRSSGIFR